MIEVFFRLWTPLEKTEESPAFQACDSAFFPSKVRSKSHPLPHKGKDKSKLPLQTGAVCPAGWTVSDANLTPQKHWLSFHQRNLIGNEILKINSNQNTDAFHKKAEVSKRKVLFSFCTCISKSKNPHQIPGNRISSIFTLILKPFSRNYKIYLYTHPQRSKDCINIFVLA